jgi:hemolysin activation/secretion protein
VDGWVRRYSIGVGFQDDTFALEPNRIAPEQLPSDEKLVVPFFRFEVIEDRFERLENRNQIGRPEFFALGLASTLQLGRASTGFGSSRNAWLYSGTVSRGFVPAPEHTLIASAAISGRYADGQVRRQKFGGSVQYYLPQTRRWLFYAAGSGDTLTNPDPSDVLLLGGDNGLRGYPLRYQSGRHRALLTVEERVNTDVYPFRLFRLGGAAYLDVGRAWGGSNVNTTNPGWLANVGLGLRIFNVRAAFSNVLHVDLAFPLVRDADIERVQILVKTRASF